MKENIGRRRWRKEEKRHERVASQEIKRKWRYEYGKWEN